MKTPWDYEGLPAPPPKESVPPSVHHERRLVLLWGTRDSPVIRHVLWESDGPEADAESRGAGFAKDNPGHYLALEWLHPRRGWQRYLWWYCDLEKAP